MNYKLTHMICEPFLCKKWFWFNGFSVQIVPFCYVIDSSCVKRSEILLLLQREWLSGSAHNLAAIQMITVPVIVSLSILFLDSYIWILSGNYW